MLFRLRRGPFVCLYRVYGCANLCFGRLWGVVARLLCPLSTISLLPWNFHDSLGSLPNLHHTTPWFLRHMRWFWISHPSTLGDAPWSVHRDFCGLIHYLCRSINYLFRVIMLLFYYLLSHFFYYGSPNFLGPFDRTSIGANFRLYDFANTGLGRYGAMIFQFFFYLFCHLCIYLGLCTRAPHLSPGSDHPNRCFLFYLCTFSSSCHFRYLFSPLHFLQCRRGALLSIPEGPCFLSDHGDLLHFLRHIHWMSTSFMPFMFSILFLDVC